MRTIAIQASTLRTYEGNTIQMVAQKTSQFWYPIRIFLLADAKDDTGRMVATGYSLSSIIRQNPALAEMVVRHAEFYYGELILRVDDAPKSKEDTL